MSLQRPPRAKDVARKRQNGQSDDLEKEEALCGPDLEVKEGAAVEECASSNEGKEAMVGFKTFERREDDRSSIGMSEGTSSSTVDGYKKRNLRMSEGSVVSSVKTNDVAEFEAGSHRCDSLTINNNEKSEQSETNQTIAAAADVELKLKSAQEVSVKCGKSEGDENEEFENITRFKAEKKTKDKKKSAENIHARDGSGKDQRSAEINTAGKPEGKVEKGCTLNSNKNVITAEGFKGNGKKDWCIANVHNQDGYRSQNVFKEEDVNSRHCEQHGELCTTTEGKVGSSSNSTNNETNVPLKTKQEPIYSQNSIFDNGYEDHNSACSYLKDGEIFYTCPPENIASQKVTFQVGGDEEEEENWIIHNSCAGKHRDFSNGLTTAGKTHAAETLPNQRLSPTSVINRQRYEYHYPTVDVDSSIKETGRKRVSIELPRGIYSDHSKTRQQEVPAKTKKRVSIEEPHDYKISEIARPSSQSNLQISLSSLAAINRADHGGNGGILKHSVSPPRQYTEVTRDVNELMEDSQRYRRRSQLNLSPDIPVDVPLKHRQVENEVRNKNNLEFIRRRVSVQEEQRLHQELTVDTNHGISQDSALAFSEPVSVSSPGYNKNNKNSNLHTWSDRPVRKSGLGHLTVPRHRFPDISVPVCHGNYIISTGNGSNSTSPSYISYEEADFTDLTSTNRPSKNVPAFSEQSQPQSLKCLGKESAGAIHSREGSVASSTIVIEREVDEAEIVDYLGNIHPDRRRYGLPQSPRDHLQGSQSNVARRVERQKGDSYQVYYTNKTCEKNDDDNVFLKKDKGDAEDPSMQPYVPIKRQRISFQDTAHTGHVWTVKGHDNQAYQDFPVPVAHPQRCSSHDSSLDSFASGSASTLDLSDQRFSPCRIRKDSLAIFNSKLTGRGRGRLRRLSQASLEHIQQATRKNVSYNDCSI